MCKLCDSNEPMPGYDSQNRLIMDGVVWWDGDGVNATKLREQMIKLAEEKPLEVRECFYSRPEGDTQVACCIVGQGVYDLTGKVVHNGQYGGVASRIKWVSALVSPELAGEYGQYDNVDLTKLVHHDPYVADMKFVRAVQKKQDQNWPWGAAVKWALWREFEGGGFQGIDF